jgi:hypothetical protein
MSKKNKRSHHDSNNFSNCPVDRPLVVDMDTLAYATDEELREREKMLSYDKDVVIRSGFDPYHWEVELAYVLREQNVREVRRIFHEKYVRNNPDLFLSGEFENESN